MATDTRNDALVQAAMEYAALGWRVVPLHCPIGNDACSCGRDECEAIGKHPRIKEWQKNATTDEEQIAAWWDRWDNANVGVQLGPESNLIDIECDSEQAEKDFQSLFGTEPLVCPSFDGKRGKHRLFRWRDGLPQKAVFHFGEVEVRTGNGQRGAQSVFPPSTHASGHVYRWSVSPSEAPPPSLPDAVFAKLVNAADEGSVAAERPKSARMQLYEQEKVYEGNRDNVLYAEACTLWGEQYRMHGERAFDAPDSQATVFARLWAWNVAKCVPPLPNDMLCTKSENARQFIRNQARERNGHGQNLTALGLDYRDGEWWPGEWRIESVNSDPPISRLYAPFLQKRPIELTTQDLDSATKVHQAVLGATGTICLDDGVLPWRAIWKGYTAKGKDGKKAQPVRGLMAKLLDAAIKIEAPREVRRINIVADFLASQFERLKVLDSERQPNSNTAVFRRSDGAILFSFKALNNEAQFDVDRITRPELSKLVREIGVIETDVELSNGSRKRFMMLDHKAQEKLAKLTSRANSPI